MNVTRVTTQIIRTCFYLLFALVPLLLTPWNYELFEYNKMMAVYALTVIIASSWIVQMISEKQIRIAKSYLDIPIVLFIGSQLISTLFSIDPHVSWLGYYSRFNGGLLSIFSYAVLYYAFLTHITDVLPFLKTALSTGIVVALYGVAERMGIDKHLWVQDVQNRVFSTLGQPNWLAAYLVGLSPVAWALATKSKKWSAASAWWTGVGVLFFLTLLFTRSRSGLLAFGIADLLFWGVLFWKSTDKKYLRIPFGVLHITAALIIFFNGTHIPALDSWVTFRGLRTRIFHTAPPAPEATASAQLTPALESGGTESGVIRKYVWEGALTAWRSSPKTWFIGTGTETFAFAFYQYRPQGHNLTSEWDFLYNKAHNEYLNFLTTTGIAGLTSYLLILASFIWWFIKTKPDILTAGLFAGWASVLVTNFFGFSVVITQIFFFLFPACARILSDKKISLRTRHLLLPPASVWLTLGVGAYLLFLIGKFWYADTLFASGYRLTRTGTAGQALTQLSRAAQLNPAEPLYKDELAALLAALAVHTYGRQDATAAAQFMQQSISLHDEAITISPANVNFWKTRTKIFVTLSEIDPQFTTHAIQALEQSLVLSPHDPKILYNLAILYGRNGEIDKALSSLNQARALKPNYRDAYFGLWAFYSELGQVPQAREILETYLRDIDPHDKDFQERLQ